MTAPGAPADRDVDVVVVGGGPAGSCAALVAARAGLSVVLLERGPFPGSKNMYGGVVYPRILDELIPAWWEEAPIQRWVTRRSTMLLTDTQALTVDFRAGAWGAPPYNGATAYRPDFDNWLAGHAQAAGAQLITSTTATGLLRDAAGTVIGVRTDRPDGDLTAHVVIACDGVNSFLAKEAGLYEHTDAKHFTLGVKETLALPKHVIDERFGVRGREGVDIEIIGATGGVNGGGFLYTNLDTIAIGVVLKLSKLSAQQQRPEQIIATLKQHPAIAPLVQDGELKEYSAHIIPEAGLTMMPKMTMAGMLVAGDAAALCLAAGIWLEGVNFAMASGMYAGEAAVEAVQAHDTSAAGLAGYQRRLSDTFVLKDHRKLRRAPALVLSDRVQHLYPGMVANVVERMFRVDNPHPKPGVRRIFNQERKRAGVRRRDLLRDGWTGFQELRMTDHTGHTRAHPAEILAPNAWGGMSFQERMATAEFRIHHQPHIVVDGKVCADCGTRECVVACPANLFVPTSDGGIVFNHEQCFECGTCYLVCNREGAISWHYPEGGHGVVFRRT